MPFQVLIRAPANIDGDCVSACYDQRVQSDESTERGARRPWTRVAAGAALGAALLTVPAVASAQRCPSMAGAWGQLEDIDASVRLGYIQRRLRSGAARATVWSYGWGTAYAAMAAFQGVRIRLANDYTTQMESALGAGSSVLGVAALVLMPPAIMGDADRLDAGIANLRPGDDRCALLRDAERYLLRDADNQSFGIGWLMQSVTLAYNIGLGLVFGLWLHDWTGAAITMGTGIAASELMTFTQPTDAIDALRRYRLGDLRRTSAPSTSYWIAAPDIAPDHAGLTVRGAF
jgi:hypothetical protein